MAKISIVYWSGTGNTEAMAEALKKGVEEKGNELNFVHLENDILDQDVMLSSDVICFGSPACGSEQINEDYFEPLMEELEDKLNGRKIFLFGSYGHGDGEFMDTWKDQITDFGAKLVHEPVITVDDPEEDIISELVEIGKNLA